MATSLKKYGNVCSVQNPDIHKKIKENNIQKYGVEYPLQNEDIRNKTRNSLLSGDFMSRITSKQQEQIHKIFQGDLNYQIYPYLVDIYFKEEKIFFEYDGGGHNLRVKCGQLSQEEFNQKEVERTAFLKNKGLKEFRIIDSSKKGNLPSDEILLKIKNNAFKILKNKQYTTYIFNLDNNTETYY